jgi:hypothetical protein
LALERTRIHKKWWKKQKKKKPWRKKKRRSVIGNGRERKMTGEVAVGKFIKENQWVR